MLRLILRGLPKQQNWLRIFTKAKSDVNKNNFIDNNIVYESEYFYKKDRELLESLKKRILQDIKTMQNQIQDMKLQIDEYDRNINEDLKFLKSLEEVQPVTSDEKNSH